MTFEEIGQKLGLSTSGTAIIFNRGMKKLKQAENAEQIQALLNLAHTQTTYAYPCHTKLPE